MRSKAFISILGVACAVIAYQTVLPAAHDPSCYIRPMAAGERDDDARLRSMDWGIGHEEIMTGRAVQARDFVRAQLLKLSESARRQKMRGLNIGSARGLFSQVIEEWLPNLEITNVDFVDFGRGRPLTGRFIQASAEALPIPDKSQDFIVSTFLLNYTDANRAAAEMFRALHGNGWAVLVLHSRRSTLLKEERRVRGQLSLRRIFERLAYGFKYDEIIDTRTLTVQIAEIRNALIWLVELEGLTDDYKSLNEHFRQKPDSRYLHYGTIRSIEGWLANRPAAGSTRNKDLLLAVRYNISDLQENLVQRLLWASRPNIIENKYGIRRFFRAIGFDVLDVQTIRDQYNRPYAFGVVLRKPAVAMRNILRHSTSAAPDMSI